MGPAIAALLIALIVARVFGGEIRKWVGALFDRLSGEHDPY